MEISKFADIIRSHSRDLCKHVLTLGEDLVEGFSRVCRGFRGLLTDLGRVTETLGLVRYDAAEKGHEWDPMQATVAVLPKEVTRPTVFVRILEGNQLVEELDEFIKDEVVVDNVPDEFSRHQRPKHGRQREIKSSAS